jgi:hypothetical protein
MLSGTDPELWRSLREGDRVRIVHLPCEFSEHEYTMHDDTRAAHRHIIDTKEVLRVSEIDDLGYPWVRFKIEAEDGLTYHHALMLNHDGIERA